MAIDEKRIKQFLNVSDKRRLIASVVRRAGFVITWATSKSGELWGMYLRPNKDLSELLGTSREILLWVTQYNDFQARAISQATELIEEEAPRLCEDIAFIVSGDPDAQRDISESTITSQTHFVGFSMERFHTFTPHGEESFILAIQQQLYAKDLYYVSGAITNRRAFFGRDNLIRELYATLNTGASHVALFGLRKTGKTSLLYRLVDLLRQSRLLLHVHLDLQKLDAISPSTEYFLWSIGEQFYLGYSVVRAARGLRLFGQHQMFSDVKDKAAIPELFDHDLRLLMAHTTRAFLIMLDEIELMSPDAPGSAWGDAYVRCWRLLRGLDQTNRGRLRFLVVGTNPRCVEANQLGGKENPTYNYFTKRFLGPLAESESNELTQILGRRMGLTWEPSALRRVFLAVGGHPFLLRSFCSRVHRTFMPRTRARGIQERDVSGLISTVLVDISSTLSQMVEVLEGQYSNEYYLLQLLAAGRVGEFKEFAEAFPDEVAHLRGYGLIAENHGVPGLTVEFLQTWLQRRAKERDSAPKIGPGGDVLAPGTVVDGYVIESTLGRPGGYGIVYRARATSLGGALVALKILKSASLVGLQREVDVLSEISDPAIVRILDHGKFSSGEVFVAMEFLDGPTLREFCTRATRLKLSDALCTLRGLLKALVSLHPNERRVAEFRRKQSDLTASEFRELEIARHGYVHRDIKPENVILADECHPVLIDFGISVRVSTPIRTLSATPGYLPPDALIGAWTPDVDLYQLGLTMLQAVTGLQYDGSNLEDLRAIANVEIDLPLRAVILKLCAPTRESRYRTAYEALSDLGSG